MISFATTTTTTTSPRRFIAAASMDKKTTTRMMKPSRVRMLTSRSSCASQTNNKIRRRCKPRQNVFHFLLEGTNVDVVSRILVFGGPDSIRNLSLVSKEIKAVVDQERHWKVLCLEYGKVDRHEKVLPSYVSSWKDLYYATPIVPTDYSSVYQAAKATMCRFQEVRIIVLGRCIESASGKHHNGAPRLVDNYVIVEETIHIHPEKCLRIQGCTTGSTSRGTGQGTHPTVLHGVYGLCADKPMFHIHGNAKLFLSDITLHHLSIGQNTGSGNSAIFVSGGGLSSDDNDAATPCFLELHGVTIQSLSGRGIMAKGSSTRIQMHNSMIRDCASTGIYLQDAAAVLYNTTIIGNGQGGLCSSLPPGHSGIFLEDCARIEILHCLVQSNIGPGISKCGNNNEAQALLHESAVVEDNLMATSEAEGDNAFQAEFLLMLQLY